MGVPGPENRQEPARAEPPPPRASYYVRNPWRTWASAAFAGASMMLTVITAFYALGRLPLALVGLSVALAAAVFGFGLYARRRAARSDAEAGLG